MVWTSWIIAEKTKKKRGKKMSRYDYPNLSAEQRQMYRTIAIIENSAAQERLREAEAVAFEERKKEQLENEKLAAQHLEHSRREREIEAGKLREESNKNLEIQLRERFFNANPMALESDYLRVKTRMKDDFFLERTNAETERERIERSNYPRM
jgi:hypothetical protein